MKAYLVVPISLALCATSFAQDSAASAASTPPSVSSTQSSTSAPIGAALTKYVAAYNGRSLQDLLAVWPSLQNEKKEFNKVKEQFSDPRISDEHLTLKPLETRTLNDDAIVECQRNEEFVKTQTNTDFGGDLNMGASPAQSIPPGQRRSKSTVKKNEKVWIKLHKLNGDWQIVGVSGKRQSL